MLFWAILAVSEVLEKFCWQFLVNFEQISPSYESDSHQIALATKCAKDGVTGCVLCTHPPMLPVSLDHLTGPFLPSLDIMAGRALSDHVKRIKGQKAKENKLVQAVNEYWAELEKPEDYRKGLCQIVKKFDVCYTTL